MYTIFIIIFKIALVFVFIANIAAGVIMTKRYGLKSGMINFIAAGVMIIWEIFDPLLFY